MANRWKGNIIAAAATTSSGTDYTGKANGAWGLNSQLQQKQAGLWAKAQSVPSIPTIGTAVKGNAQATVNFTGSVGGGTITYTATSSPGGFTNTGTSSPIIVNGLTNETSYTFTVTATNEVGTSLPSAASNSVTPSGSLEIGQAYGGGFYAGKISTTGNGVATHYLVVAPKATGETQNLWSQIITVTGITSVINGPTNSASLATLGTSYRVANFCENLTIGGYSDWYLPAKNELEVLYYNLKPTTDVNDTRTGSNANAVSPEPINTNYTTNSPTQTSAVGFRTGEINAFVSSEYWASTEINNTFAWAQQFLDGWQESEWNNSKNNFNVYARAVRRVPIV